GVSQNELDTALVNMKNEGLVNVLALRGDPPHTGPQDGPCQFANELVTLIKKDYPNACVAAACYPETHTGAPSRNMDLQNLKLKADAGVDLFITQLFFDNRHY